MNAHNPLAPLQADACAHRIALGPRDGQTMLSLRTVPSRNEKISPAPCANYYGLSLHAGRCSVVHRRKKLERLCHTIARPAIAKLPVSGTRDDRSELFPARQPSKYANTRSRIFHRAETAQCST